ncbi:MAG: proline racemase [Chloroflexi bacterium]|nr:proline racemase family protein [Ardenticatenaceae bacterium]MBL1131016.1 proline racemase [Chloroflexota bacterium]NOG37114.1 proline racemase [Chloroflexota bacterium]
MPLTWTPPADWVRLTAVDAHTAGEPLRIFTSGWPAIPGLTILEKRRYAQTHHDHLRRATMWEPRGHADMYGCLLTEPVTPDGDVGVLFLHNEGFSTMCGHGIIGLTKVALDTGLIDKPGDVPVLKIDSPAGRVTAYARREEGVVTAVSFHNVPSFAYALDQVVDVPGLGAVLYDVAFGGAFYAFVRAEEVGVGLAAENVGELITKGRAIKTAVMQSLPIHHPFEPDLGFLYGVIFVGAAHDPAHHSRNVCIFAEGEVDRCPTGTGVSARAALHFARGEIGRRQPFVVESILGTTFTGEVVGVTAFGGHTAVIPQVTGTAHICGRNELLIDPTDPLRGGFILR